jgi:hypothetical protein
LNTRPLFGAALALCLSFGLAGSAFAQDAGPTKVKDDQKKDGKAESKPAETKQDKAPDKKDDKEQQQANDYAKAVKDLTKKEGVFNFYQRKKDILMELPADKLNKTFLIQASMVTGITSIILQAGSPLGGNEIDAYHFERHDDQIWLVRPNFRYRWGSDDMFKVAAQRSLPMAILGSFRVEQEDPIRKVMLINVSNLFFGDMFRLNEAVNAMLGGQYGLDRDKSAIESIDSFPTNSVIQTRLHFFSPRGADGPSIADLLGFGSDTLLEDDRSAPMKVAFNMWFRESEGYVPRLADGRVGYFTEDFYSLAKFFDTDRTKRFIFRWSLKKKDPAAAVSEPVKPIVWTIDSSVPEKYRDAVKDGILRWNRAFDELGYKNAIQVQDPPKDDPKYNHADGRYNVVRWTFSADAGYAIALARVDPFNAQILNASVTLDANMLAYIFNDFQHSTAAIESAHTRASSALLRNEKKISGDQMLWSTKQELAIDGMQQRLKKFGWNKIECEAPQGLAASASFALTTLQALGTKIDKEAYAKQFIADTICHEIGHTLGLRHNFMGSTYLNTNQLADDSLTAKENLAGSVMDYVPVNMVAVLKGKKNYFGTTIGAYDRWAIAYGYTDFGSSSPDGESAGLSKIASKAGQPGLAYQTDENADSWNPYAVRFDNSADPLNYSVDELEAAKRLRKYAIDFLPLPGQNYDLRTRLIMTSLMRTFREGRMSARFLGGIEAARSYKGDAVERPTLSPVPGKLQRQAMSLIVNNCFTPEAFNLPSDVLETMSLDPSDDMSAGWNAPLRDIISGNQMLMYATIMSADTTDRISENAYKAGSVKKDAYTMDEHFGLLLGAVFKEVGANKPIAPLRRDLQRFAVNALIIQAGAPAGTINEDARTVASDSLRRLGARYMSAHSQPNLDGMTRVYERDIADMINRFLNRSVATARG